MPHWWTVLDPDSKGKGAAKKDKAANQVWRLPGSGEDKVELNLPGNPELVKNQHAFEATSPKVQMWQYDMRGHIKGIVKRYCEICKLDPAKLKNVNPKCRRPRNIPRRT